MARTLMQKFPNIAYLAKRAKHQIPHFAWEYLDSGTGFEDALPRNTDDFSKILILPEFMKGNFEPRLEKELFGIRYSAPFGVAPVGLTGLIWPESECILAKTAAKYRIPYALSTVATQTPETIGRLANGMGWFQLYPPCDPAIRKDLLKRAHDSGFTTLLITVDTPVSSRRERQAHAEVAIPPVITPLMVYRSVIRPAWAFRTWRLGEPRFKTMEKYANTNNLREVAEFISKNLGEVLTWDYIQETRQEWPGRFVLKGILHPKDAVRGVAEGVDGLVVSNHGARQFDAAPSSIAMLPEIVEAVAGKATVILDSGVRSGLDVLKALALGADFVLLGRAFMFGVAALGTKGGDHVFQILEDEMINNMKQIGCASLEDLSNLTVRSNLQTSIQ